MICRSRSFDIKSFILRSTFLYHFINRQIRMKCQNGSYFTLLIQYMYWQLFFHLVSKTAYFLPYIPDSKLRTIINTVKKLVYFLLTNVRNELHHFYNILQTIVLIKITTSHYPLGFVLGHYIVLVLSLWQFLWISCQTNAKLSNNLKISTTNTIQPRKFCFLVLTK